MSLRPITFLVAVGFAFLCGTGHVDAQYRPYRLLSGHQQVGSSPVRLPSIEGGQRGPSPAAAAVGRPVRVSYAGESSDLAGPASGQPQPPTDVPAPANDASPSDVAPAVESVPVIGGDYGRWSGGDVDYLSPYIMPRGGFFFQWDQMIWNLANDPEVTPVGTLMPEGPASIGADVFYLSNDVSTDLDSGNVHSGQRFEFGHSDGNHGWMFSIMFGEATRRYHGSGINFVPDETLVASMGFSDLNPVDGIDDDVDLDTVFGRAGQDVNADGQPDLSAPMDLDDAVYDRFPFDSLVIRDKIDMAGAEVNRTIRLSPKWQWFYGIRYADFRQRYSITGSGVGAGLQTVAKSQILGPQIGARFTWPAYKFIFNFENRFVPGYNHQRRTQMGRIAPRDGAAPILPTTLFAANNDEFSAIYEVRADMIMPINRFLAFRMGYTGLLMSGIGFTSPKIHYDMPQLGITDIDTNETIYVNAFTIGLELNR